MKKIIQIFLIFFCCAFFGNSTYAITSVSVEDDTNISCVSTYEPVCWYIELTNCYKVEGWDGWCFTEKTYKTFSNSCELGLSEYEYAYSWECKEDEPVKSIVLSAPNLVKVWNKFNFKWEARWDYDYCYAIWDDVKLSNWKSWLNSLGKLKTSWYATILANEVLYKPQVDWSTSSNSSTDVNISIYPKTNGSITLGVVCYYEDEYWREKKDSNYATIDLIDEVCKSMDQPVCWKKEYCKNTCEEWEVCTMQCLIWYKYKTFNNKCELENNKEWYKYYKAWECDTVEPVRNISIEAPKSVDKGDKFEFSWYAKWYKYCTPFWSSVLIDNWVNWLYDKQISTKWELTLVWKDAKYPSKNYLKLGLTCYYQEANSTKNKSHMKSVKVLLKEDIQWCTEEYAPVCWKRQYCKNTCKEWQICTKECLISYKYKTFGNKCELENNNDWYIYGYKWTCKSVIEECPIYDIAPAPEWCYYKFIIDFNWCKVPKLVCEPKIDDKTKMKLDKAIGNLLRKIENKYSDSEDRVRYIKRIIVKLEAVKKKKEKFEDIINYIIEELEEAIDKYINEDTDIDDILDILN